MQKCIFIIFLICSLSLVSCITDLPSSEPLSNVGPETSVETAMVTEENLSINQETIEQITNEAAGTFQKNEVEIE